MLKLGIYGGTFNPIHIGHLIVAQSVLEYLNLDKIIFIPVGNPPHKDSRNIVNGVTRINMLNKAIDGNSFFEVSDIEVLREGKTYTYDTLTELREKFKQAEINFIIGYDTLIDIDTWHRVHETLNLARFIVVNRDGDKRSIEKTIELTKNRYGGEYVLVNIPSIGISSSDIRRRVREGKSIKYMVTNEVNQYITDNKLYRGD
ncbi:MAG: nicotinate-nucleotide adenylyltransferase [Clostridium sp.]|uniref:nicotinate-nucleotide adenylyltransferase n=1 Tax=Clostridium sp. TaxID=1506 RepID=UPI002FCC1CB0